MSAQNTNTLSPVEKIKENSNFLRGTINESLLNEITGSVTADDAQLTKFHGIYQQTARELDVERKKQKLEPLYSFMVRVRVPGGVATPEQWIAMDDQSDRHANGTIKLTTRQAFQFHGILKRNLRQHIYEVNQSLLDTIAACGDVNRNVMCSPNPEFSDVHAEAYTLAKKINDRLTPKTTAYHEIWIEGKKISSSEVKDNEPIYGKTYLPRKFKIAVAIPPDNDTDIYTNDIGLIAVVENNKLLGFNVVAGGGMGNTFGDDRTHPRLADMIGFYRTSYILPIVEEIVKIQRDHGNRSDRKIARLKYTIERNGLDWFKAQLYHRTGLKPDAPKPFRFTGTTDRYGWLKGTDNKWYYTLFVEGGRVKNTEAVQMKKALREVAELNTGDFRLTANQNLTIGKIEESDKIRIDDILTKHGVKTDENYTTVRKSALACVALFTCTLAHAEAETYLPSLMDKIETMMQRYKIENESILIRMTGCPNGCARPYNAEIGFVGRAPGTYNMYLGGDKYGTRLNKLYKEMLKEDEILDELDYLLHVYARERNENEDFGDFIIRKQLI